ncbi:hypothetical protein KJ841_01525 [Patescibacteria group bacterium]|nr:hypothetical protein [Patescibacteria group bacterium]
MKVVTIFIIIIIAVAAYSVFDEYLKKENLPEGLELQENKPLTANVSKSIQPNNPSPNQIKSETTKDEVIEITQEEVVDTSPYYGKVKISNIQAQTEYRPSLINLRVNIYPGEKINLTGWKIKARKGEIIIPKGIEKYQSHITPRDIIIKEYTNIYLINDSNPLGRDKNFCLNKCFGYIKNYNSFYPSFYTYCPKPKLEDVSHLNPYCQEYILRLSSCEIPNYSNNIKIATDSKCVSFLNNTFNYSSCFKEHSKDEDFLKNYWYVYVGTDIVEPLHDTIYLYDPNGLLVDKYMY